MLNACFVASLQVIAGRLIMGASSGLVAALLLLGSLAEALVQSPPQIVKQPPSDELLFQVAQRIDENDKPFIIECEAEAEPAPK